MKYLVLFKSIYIRFEQWIIINLKFQLRILKENVNFEITFMSNVGNES